MNDIAKQETTAVAEASRPKLQPVTDNGEFSMLLDSDRFAQIQRVASLFADSTLVPETFQGRPANCAVALQMAFRMHVDPMMLMQNIHVVHNKPGLDGKMAIALINSRGPFTGPLQWKFEGAGETRKCTVYATHKVTKEVCELAIDWSTVKGEGWDKNTKWKTMQDQMFRYRTASWFGRAYCPEVLMGLPTVDELDDVGERVVTGERITDTEPIPMPTARPAEAAATAATAPAIEGKVIDKETGEITDAKPAVSEAAAAEMNAKVAETKPPEKETKNGMGTLASESQRKVIMARAVSRGFDMETLDKVLAEEFSFTFNTMPANMVNNVLVFLRPV